jgi:hypothetical protein
MSLATNERVMSFTVPTEAPDTEVNGGDRVESGSSSRRPESKFRYDPPDNERPYYDRLFRLARGSPRGIEENGDDNDVDDGLIILPPGDAARFFLTSGVPSDRLRLIWNMAVAPAIPYPKGVKPPPAMTKCQFQSAVRLIQLYQNKVSALNETLSVVDDINKVLKPVYFGSLTRSIEGMIERSHNLESLNDFAVTKSMNDGDTIERNETYRTSNVKLGTDVRTVANSFALMNPTKEDGVAESKYSMSRDEEMNYREAFTRHCVTDGGRQYVYVDAAVSFFERSGVSRDTLGKVWDIVTSNPNAGKLDEREFVVMSHLIICLTKRGLAIPEVLPMSLRNWRVGRSRRAVSDNDEDNVVFNQLMTDPMMRMESELRSLKLLVNSLRAEVRDLREIVMHGGHTTNGDVSAGGPKRRLATESDVPNVDVEIYWSEKKDILDESGTKEATNKLKKETASPLDLSELSSSSRDRIMLTRAKSSNLRKSTTGVSQHIPTIHPRTQPSSRRLTIPPQTRHTDVISARDSFQIGTSKSAFYEAHGTYKSDRPSQPGRTMSILKAPTYNSTTPNQQEQKDVQLDSRKKSSMAKIKVGRFNRSMRQANENSTI